MDRARRDDSTDEHGRPTKLIPSLDGGGFDVRPSAIHGNGVFATRAFRAGEPIGHAATTRSRDQVTRGDAVAVDRTVLGRYINHAREANTRLAELKPGLLHMVATRDIPEGGELTCHYVDAIHEQLRSYDRKNPKGDDVTTKQADAYPEERRLGRAVKRVDPEPTVAQREAGNFRMGHVRMHGLNISVEVADGHVRTGMGKDGKVWKKRMKCHYGYIKRTKSDADGDHIDVYVGPHPQSEVVFVVDQVHSDGSFDEHKSFLGFITQEEAKDMYLAHIPANRLGGITPMTMKDFKHWAFKGNTRLPVKRASLLDCEQPPGVDYISTFPKLAAVVDSFGDTSGVLMGAESMGQAAPRGITFDDEPAAGQIQPILGPQPAEPLPPMPPQPPKGPGAPPTSPQIMPPGTQPMPPAPLPPPPTAQGPGQPAPAPPMPAQPAPPAAAAPMAPPMPPKLAALMPGPRGPVYIGEDSPLADPRVLVPSLSAGAGVALGGPTTEDRARGGLKGLLTGLGGVGGGMLGHAMGGGTPGMLAGGAGGGLLALLLARKLLDPEPQEYNVVKFRKRAADEAEKGNTATGIGGAGLGLAASIPTSMAVTATGRGLFGLGKRFDTPTVGSNTEAVQAARLNPAEVNFTRSTEPNSNSYRVGLGHAGPWGKEEQGRLQRVVANTTGDKRRQAQTTLDMLSAKHNVTLSPNALQGSRAHELGHARVYNALRPKARLANMLAYGAGRPAAGVGGALAPVLGSEYGGDYVAGAATLATMPMLAHELAASHYGGRANLRQLRPSTFGGKVRAYATPYKGVPTYAAASALPLAAYYTGEKARDWWWPDRQAKQADTRTHRGP